MDLTTIVSDTHLGSDVCCINELLQLLDGLDDRSNRLILNGDIFESLDMRKMNKKHRQALAMLRKLSNKMEVVWVVGNHDGPSDKASVLFGSMVFDRYVLHSGDKKVLVLHGHVFDDFIKRHPFLTWVGDTIYSFLQSIDRSHNLARMAKYGTKTYLKCAEDVRLKAVALAMIEGFDAICCGHTHFAETTFAGNITYINSGCWTERPCSYIEMTDGVASIKVFNN